MKSFLKEIESKFKELEETDGNSTTHGFVDDSGLSDNGEEEIDEQNVTGAIAGYNTPGAFTTNKKFKKKKFTWAGGQVNESVNTPASYKIGEHQHPESDEEVFNDKFPFAITDEYWWQNDNNEYPTKFYKDGMGTNSIQDKTTQKGNLPQPNKFKQVAKHTLKVEDVLEKKYEQLIEGYRDFKTGDVKPSSKVKSTIQEIAKKLQEIETLVNYNSKLKNESGVTSDSYGPATQKALNKISERLLKISERVRSLGE